MMNIRNEILVEHSRSQALKIAAHACSSKNNFKELMCCFVDEDYRVAQRAAWSVRFAAASRPDLLQPYIKDLVHQLNRKDVHDAVIRNSIRILEGTEIPRRFHGTVMNACFNFIENNATPSAIKAFALTTLYKLAGTYPEIRQELKLIIEERWWNESAAFKSRAKKILAQLSIGK